ncbi:MAG: ORF6N domain-containing protein [Terracidiphilus sp.]
MAPTRKLKSHIVTSKTGIPAELVEHRILSIRGQNVMLDSDLAELYEVETKALNLAVRRNADRFPEDFMFQLTPQEFQDLRFQFATSSSWGGRRYPPLAFTEQALRCCRAFSAVGAPCK